MPAALSGFLARVTFSGSARFLVPVAVMAAAARLVARRGASPSEEGHEFRANDFVEEGLLGLVEFVSADGVASAGTGGTR